MKFIKKIANITRLFCKFFFYSGDIGNSFG